MTMVRKAAATSADVISASSTPYPMTTSKVPAKSTDWKHSSTIISTTIPSATTSVVLTPVPSTLQTSNPVPQSNRISPVAIAVPLAVCGLIGFIALLFCAKKRSASQSTTLPPDLERDWHTLITQRLSAEKPDESQDSTSSNGVTIVKREETDVAVPTLNYDHGRAEGTDRPPVIFDSEKGNIDAGERRRNSQMDELFRSRYDYIPSIRRDAHRSDDEYYHQQTRLRSLRNVRPLQHDHAAISLMSNPTSRGETCVTPHRSHSRDDYFSRPPLRSYTARTGVDDSNIFSRQSSARDYEHRREKCASFDCDYSRKPPRRYDDEMSFTRPPSSLSRERTEDGSFVNPHPRHSTYHGGYPGACRPAEFDEAEEYIRDRFERSRLPSKRWSGTSIGTETRSSDRHGATPDVLCESLRVALEAR